MEKKVFILIQGHTHHCDFFIEHYKDFENVVWATDESAPNINKIRDAGIIVETIPPMSSGHGNINVQVATVMVAIKKIKELGGTHCIKLRSDMYITDNKKFIDNMVDDGRIHQLSYVNHFQDNRFPKEVPAIDSWIKGNNIEVKDICGYNYILDFTNYGPIDEMSLFWDYPFEHTPLPVPAEHKFIFRYLQLKGKEIDMSFEHLSEVFGFFLTSTRELGIGLPSIKRNCDWVNLGTGKSEGGFLG